MSTIPPPDPSEYMREAAAQDEILDERLIRIRAQADLGTMTIRQAADARVAALEHHIEAVKALRAEYFGEDQGCAEHLVIGCEDCQSGDNT